MNSGRKTSPVAKWLPFLIGTVLFILACSGSGQEPLSVEPSVPRTLPVNGLYNSGFEQVADGTTTPVKYGAYWMGAFSQEPGESEDLIEKGDAHSGKRYLKLFPSSGRVHQKVVTDLRWTDRIRIILAVRLERGASLEVALEDGRAQSVTALFSRSAGKEDENRPQVGDLTARWKEGTNPTEEIRLLPAFDPERRDWTVAVLDAGARFAAHHGLPALPRLKIVLECIGPEEAWADLDDLYAAVHWPAPSAAGLANIIAEHALWTLETWFLDEQEGGLQLVDPDTGYVKVSRFDIKTGKNRIPNALGNLHTIYEILIRWIDHARQNKWDQEVRFWTPFLERFVRTLLTHNFDPKTGLPRTVFIEDLAPNEGAPVTVGAFIEFLLKAREVIDDDDLKAQCLATAKKTADRLITLQQEHDLPKRKNRNQIRYNADQARFEGRWPNWFGHIPDRLSPDGAIETPKKFNTSWAIVTGRTFWYHLFKSAAGIMAVHELAPDDTYIPAVEKVLANYHRDWDATRYDLENDTDDHYGYLCEDLLRIAKRSNGRLDRALHLLEEATDHRLAGNATEPGDTLWIQAVRLGTACAGDSPRAMTGLMGLCELPHSINPLSARADLFRESLLELARNDLKGRQLTNGQFTESFFKNWEMVCICFRGSYQGDCRDHPPDFWHGDVGDTFGGPPVSAINAQVAAFRAARLGERRLILSAMEIIRYATDHTMARRYGYLYGLDSDIARQYELPDKYVMGLKTDSPAGVGYVLAWLKALPWLQTCRDPLCPTVERLTLGETENDNEDLSVLVKIEGPPGGLVVLPVYRGEIAPYPAPLSETDFRMTAFGVTQDLLDSSFSVLLGNEGRATITLDLDESRYIVVQPVLCDPDGGAPLALGDPYFLREPGGDGSHSFK